jgi:mono/diheme cytochrome c family protein
MKASESVVHPLGRAAALALCAAALALGGCRGERADAPPRQFFPDMDDQPRWDPQEASRFFEDGRTMRYPPAGTVAFARAPLDPAVAGNADWAETFRLERANLLQEDDVIYHGGRVDENGRVVEFAAEMPMPVTMAMLERGRERFNIYCSVCHGYTGDGRGMVGQQWSYALPTFYDPKYSTPDEASNLWRDGYIFSVTRLGVKDATGAEKMPPYAHALSIQDSWAIVAYIRALQRSNAGRIDDVPPMDRQILEQQRPAAVPAGASPAPAGQAGPAGGQEGGQ